MGCIWNCLENTVEIPTIPKTKKGLKFDAAAQELKVISDEFFKLRNHNFQYKSVMKEILKMKLKNLEKQQIRWVKKVQLPICKRYS